MFPARFFLAATLPLAVAACGVPDLIAHGVKSYERSQEGGTSAAADPQPVATPAAARQTPAARPAPSSSGDGDFVPAPAPQRESVSAEPLR